MSSPPTTRPGDDLRMVMRELDAMVGSEKDTRSRSLARRCLELCLRASAANDVADRVLLRAQVRGLLAAALTLRG